MNTINKERCYILIYSLFIVFTIAIYGKFRCSNKDFNDPLLLKLGIWDLDGWSLTHLFFHMSLGYLFPKHIFYITFFAVLWELFEWYVGVYKPTFANGLGHCLTTDNDDIDSEKVWWYGKISDIIVNLTGFIIGYCIRKNVK